MSVIDQLDQTVTPVVLGDDRSVPHISLLEQFYAIFIMRLAQPAIYSQLLRDGSNVRVSSNASATLFEQLWQEQNQRQLLIDELAAIHHIETASIETLLLKAAPLTYQALKDLAEGQFLPAFLQAQQPSIRQYLPVWAEEVIAPIKINNQEIDLNKSPPLAVDMVVNDNLSTSASAKNTTSTDASLDVTDAINATNAIHVRPSDYHDAPIPNSRIKAGKRKNTLIIPALILIGMLGVIGLVWALVIQPNYSEPEESIAVAPSVTVSESEPAAQVLTPAELAIGVDNAGDLYNCTATVGDIELQSALQKALNVSFGEQANDCELVVQQGFAKQLANIEVAALPNVFTLLRSVPFARLQLQNDVLNLEAPDNQLLQLLLTDMRTLIPTLSITSAEPIPLPDNIGTPDRDITDSEMADSEIAGINRDNNALISDSRALTDNQDYQAADDDTGDSVMPAPPYRNNNDNNFDSDNNSNVKNNINTNDTAALSTTLSVSEVDELANSTIVAEKLRNERPVDKDLPQNQ